MKAVYVAAPYGDAAGVRVVHTRLRSLNFEPTSRWAEHADGVEDFATMTPAELAEIAARNDYDVRRSHAMLVMAREGVGGETFAEARFGLLLGLGVVWLGRRTLSAWRSGVVRVETLDEALEALAFVVGRAA